MTAAAFVISRKPAGRPPLPVEPRFFERVMPEPMSGCWLWLGDILRPPLLPYGRISVQGKTLRAHRVSWLIHKGPIPGDQLVLHKCDNAMCVNPDHLYLGSHGDNSRDVVARDRARWQSGDERAASKLTDGAVRAIRKDTRSLSEIAREYGIAISLASLVRNRKRWKHVAD